MAKGLSEILAQADVRADGLRVAIPETWLQGRTTYGGLTSALALAAATRVGGEGLAPLRSAQISMIAPVNGTVDVEARVLRRGRNVTWVAADLLRDGNLALSASFAFMAPVASGLQIDLRPPPADLIQVDQATDFTMHRAPVFLSTHFEVRHALPRRDEKRAEICWWVRARERDGLDPMIALLLCGDALPPGVFPLLDPATPVSSMQWQATVLTPAPTTRDGWWLLRSAGDFAGAGLSSQPMGLWSADGIPVLAGMQSIAVFG